MHSHHGPLAPRRTGAIGLTLQPLGWLEPFQYFAQGPTVKFRSSASIIHKKTLIKEVNCKSHNNKREEEEPEAREGLYICII